MAESGEGPDSFFFRHRGGRNATGELARVFGEFEPFDAAHPYWSDEHPQAMLIEEVEAIWSAIAEQDDWAPLYAKVAAVRRMGEAHGPMPTSAGHRAVARRGIDSN